jgi:integral membrane protein
VSRELRAYRTMAYVVGAALILLVFIGVPLQLGADQPGVVAILGPIHGFLYIVYLVTAANLARRTRFTLRQLLAIVGAGLLPFLAFIVERRVTRIITAQQEPADPPGR